MSPSRRTRARRRGAGAIACAATFLFVTPHLTAQQQVARADSSLVVRRAGDRGDVLSRTVSLSLNSASIESALRDVASQADLRLSYSNDIIPADRRLTINRRRIAAGDAIREILAGTDLDVVVSPAGYVIVVRSPWRALAASAPPRDSVRIPLVDAPLLRAPSRAQVMDRILVMGSPATGASERSLASAVSVITSSQIAQLGVTNMEQLFRNAIPGIVAWDLGVSGPFGQISSVRGSSSFTSNYLKTYVDGVELASPYLLFAIDPYSVERIEIIRGPQGSALYGSDAISGVVQVITRKGTPSANWKPQADVTLSAGRMESHFTNGANAMQRHSAMLFTGGGTTSLGVGGTFESVGAVVPGSESGYRGTYGGFRTMLGPVRIDASTRYADIRFTSAANPLLRNTDLTSASYQPVVEPQRIENETYGITADWQPNERWRQTLVLGLDRHAGSIPPQREPAAVADALLGATQENVSKTSVRYSLTGRILAVPGAKLTATAGAERANLTRERLGAASSVIGVGSGLTALYSDEVQNTGIFGQLKLDVANALFVTAGLRGERNSSFGENYGTAYAPMFGMAWTRDLGGGATLKLRTAYGKGIRPPPPIARRAIQTAGYRQLANPDLKPEVQGGTEGGVELYAGDRATISLTAYTQNADGLVQQVLPPGRDIRTIQYQNVGRIQNRGFELEGNARAGALRGDWSFAWTDSRVRALSSTYTGELEIGDRVPEVPRTSGMASLTFEAWRVRASLGASYIGPWTGYDWLDFYSADVGVSSPKASLRGYWRTYPSLTKPFVGMSYLLRRGAEWYVRVDNLTNLQRYERDDLLITQGRTARLGLRLQH